MFVIDQILIDEKSDVFPYIDALSYQAKLLYNASLYRIRNHFTASKKTVLTVNEKEVEDEIALLGKNVGSCIHAYDLQKVMVLTHNPDYYSGIPSQVAQHVVASACNDFQNWLKALSAYKKNPLSFLGIPRMPHYKKDDICGFVLPSQTTSIKDGHIHFPKTKMTLPCRMRTGASLREIIVVPYYGRYKLSIVYTVPDTDVKTDNHVASIDFGVNNTMAVCKDDGTSVLFEGGCVKSENRWFNKERAQLVSAITAGHANMRNVHSHRLDILSRHRDLFIRDTFQKMSSRLMEWCVQNHIGTLVLGVNQLWKQGVSMNRSNNQTFVNIPFATLRWMIEYKAERLGIRIIEQEESYTSKASLLDEDEMPVYGAPDTARYVFNGNRNHRGSYVSKDGIVINADLNGAGNIMRKAGFSINVDIRKIQHPTVIGFSQLNTCIPEE